MTNKKWIDCDEFPIDEAIIRLKRLDNIVNDFYSEPLYMAIKALEAQPRPTGKWETFVEDYNKCSKCGEMGKFYRNYKYCPNCGAKMDEVETEVKDE